MKEPAIRIKELRFRWPGQRKSCLALARFELAHGERVFIHGPSGSGKSTLLALLAGMVLPQQGEVCVLGRDVTDMSAAERDRFRADHIGFIFQQFNLLPYLSVMENVLLPCRFSARRTARALQGGRSARAEAGHLLDALDITTDLHHQSALTLSVGQQQRVAAARALIGRPEIIIADEPTSSLDADRQLAFLDLLQQECAQSRASLLLVSHDHRLASRFSRSLELDTVNGPVAEDRQ